MKEVKVICPKCGNEITYKNWFSWILHTPFHWFGKRKAKCTQCGEVSYMGRKLHTKWKRVYNPIIGVRFFDLGESSLGFFTIEKLWQCKHYSKGAQRHDGTRWTHWFWSTMMQVRTDTGLVYKMPFCPWMKAYDDNNKALSDYYNEDSWMTRRKRK